MLSLKDVSYSYIGKNQRVDALKGITYTFLDDMLYSIKGPSGSGKSTLLHLIDALDRPTQGTITCEDKPVDKIQPDIYRGSMVTMIYQDYLLLPFLNILENVMYPALLRKEKEPAARMQAAELLMKVSIPEAYWKRLPCMLSGGEQQRAAIARALCSNARIILADEPTGNLDTENSNNIIHILSTLAHSERRTVIVVTHDPQIAQKADVQLMLIDGRLQQI
jgi:putative ABC transport system ATP-binding protein